jgi:peptide/nickel transport system substrate-binding protein
LGRVRACFTQNAIQPSSGATKLTRYAYDPQESRRLLAEAGYPNGFDIDFYASRNRNESEAIIGYLTAVGIRARLRFLQVSAVTTVRRAGKATLNHSDWGSLSVGDVSNSVSVFHEFSSDDINRDPEIRDLLLRGDSSMDPGERKAAYARALALIADRAYVLPLYTVPTYYLAAKDLAFDPPPDELPRFYEMSWK